MTSSSHPIIVITGASSGIGEALALEYAKKTPCSFALLARRKDRLIDLAHKLEKLGSKALPISCDVTRDSDLISAATEVRKKFGAATHVIANAGFGVKGKVSQLAIDDYRRQFETNVYGVIRTIQAFLPDLIQTQGRLGIIGSIMGFISAPGSSPYCMSKFAVHTLADSLRMELSNTGVSVTLLAPGIITSEIRKIDNKGALHSEVKDPAPDWVRMPTDKAARVIIRAIEHRKSLQLVAFHAKVLYVLHRFFPSLIRWIAISAMKRIKKA